MKFVTIRSVLSGAAGLAILAASMASTLASAASLDDALRAALANSDELSAAREEWVSARENVGTASSTSDWRATGTVTGTHASKKTPASRVYKDSQSGSASVSLSKNIYDGGQTVEKRTLGLINLEAAAANYDASEQRLVLTTIESYLNVVKANENVALNAANITRLQAHVNAAQVRVAAGAATPTRLAEATARLAKGRSSLIGAQTALRNAEDKFQTLTGMPASGLQPVATVEGLPSDLLTAEDIAINTHPSVRAAKARERAAEQEIETLHATVRPTVSLSLSATDAEAKGKQQDKTELSAQVKFSTPLLVTNATRAKTRSISAKISAAKYARNDAIRNAALNVRTAFRSMETARAQQTAVMAELEAFRLVAEGIGNEVEFGQKTALDLQDAEQDIIDAELRLVSAEHNILLSSYRLKAALGLLTADAIGMNAVLGDIEDMPVPETTAINLLSILEKE